MAADARLEDRCGDVDGEHVVLARVDGVEVLDKYGERALASYEMAIDAPAEVVWRLFTAADGLVRWVGPEAAADRVPGGALRWVHRTARR